MSYLKPANTNCRRDDCAPDLLLELEASLLATQKAVLGGDVASLEQITAEQARLRQTLGTMLDAAADLSLTSSVATSDLLGSPLVDRVLQIGRVQLALLARARQWLAILENALAGPQSSYAPRSSAGISSSSQIDCTENGESLCRV